jgi:hypothetical protein
MSSSGLLSSRAGICRSGTTAVFSGVVRGGANSVADGTTLGVRIGGVATLVCAAAGFGSEATQHAQKTNLASRRRQPANRATGRVAGPAAGRALSVTLPILASFLIWSLRGMVMRSLGICE